MLQGLSITTNITIKFDRFDKNPRHAQVIQKLHLRNYGKRMQMELFVYNLCYPDHENSETEKEILQFCNSLNNTNNFLILFRNELEITISDLPSV
mgnify:CR=1 FL=1